MIGKKLLVADDSLTIQKVIRLALSNEGYEIQTVSDGNDAIQQIAVFRPDVVLIDVSLPGKTAFEVKKSIENEKDLSPARFVLMSSAYEKVDEKEILESAFAGRLTKPFDPAHLRKILNEALSAAPSPATNRAPNPPDFQAEPEWSPELSNIPDLPPMFAGDKVVPAPEQTSPLVNLSNDNDSSNELWEGGGEFIMPPPPPHLPPGLDSAIPPAIPPAPLPPLPGMQGMPELPGIPGMPGLPGNTDSNSDIKHLTESTIRMSGLDDFQWSVNEPSLKPPGAMMEPFDSSFGTDKSSEITHFNSQNRDNYESIPLTAPRDFIEQGISLDQQSRTETTGTAQISAEQLDGLIQKHLQKAVEDALRNFAQSTLPEVAERVIKAEIHRLLSEQN